ncbi:hypothetical protein [Fructilactobacillus cliffordii]|uniref:Uncharacterized protein n=1 Tax=Fructilactobacillus cliffordii TaxID=2940299 RepID=A0A9Q8ZTA4_9LACO|nr:hypothetical protein [Fructilactobacillus cliffordii]USS86165.1 hypothetical protein M3M38_05585 [Fructilactobacillus cliffordii]USS89234.1 hypothetical protein M3M40_00010 [Fructilactobacillus cliffordii]
MSKKKLERQEREKIVTDMNEFLITYAKSVLAKDSNLAAQLYQAAKDDVTGLDGLFNDGGYGRKERYENIAQGFICNYYHIEPEDGNAEKQDLINEAVRYLGRHQDQLNRWIKE